MSNERAYTVGDYWLCKRRDGKSPDIWQIATYSAKSRSVVYRSTKRSSLEDAKKVIHGHVARQLAKQPQTLEDAQIVPQLALYLDEHGEEAINDAQLGSSVRAFIGFLMQDEAGAGATFTQAKPDMFERFRKWRMKPHSYSVLWKKKEYNHTSKGVRGETVQRNLDDVRAAFNHAARAGRIPFAPKVVSIDTKHRSPARDVRVTIDTLGAMVGYAANDKALRRWLLLMIATACRPDAALLFDPARQLPAPGLLDTHPTDAPRTKKRNPVVPIVEPFQAILDDWLKAPHSVVRSRKTAWRTMRRALGLPANIIPKVIRHTIATELRSCYVPAEQISGLLGHTAMSRITEVYAKYDPAYLREAKAVLTTIFNEVLHSSEKWAADHLRTKVGNGKTIIVDRKAQEAQFS
jgi:hypothetical protein